MKAVLADATSLSSALQTLSMVFLKTPGSCDSNVLGCLASAALAVNSSSVNGMAQAYSQVGCEGLACSPVLTVIGVALKSCALAGMVVTAGWTATPAGNGQGLSKRCMGAHGSAKGLGDFTTIVARASGTKGGNRLALGWFPAQALKA